MRKLLFTFSLLMAVACVFAAFVPQEGVYYNIVQNSTNLVVGANGTQPVVQTPANSAGQAFRFIPVEGVPDTYLIQSYADWYLNHATNNAWTTIYQTTTNLTRSHWTIIGDASTSIRLKVASSNHLASDGTTHNSSLFCDKNNTNVNGLFSLVTATVLPAITLSERNVVLEIEKDLKPYPVFVSGLKMSVDVNVIVPEGVTASPAVVTPADFEAGNGRVKVLLNTTANIGDTAKVYFTYDNNGTVVKLDSVRTTPVATYKRYYIEQTSSKMVIGNHSTGLYPALTVRDLQPAQLFLLRPVAPGTANDSTFYLVQDSDYRMMRKTSANNWDSEYGASGNEARWIRRYVDGNVFVLKNGANNAFFATDGITANSRIYADKTVTNANGRWRLVDPDDLAVSTASVVFDGANLKKQIVVMGGGLTENLVITAPAGITMSKTSLTPAEVAAKATLTATFDKVTKIVGGLIEMTTAGKDTMRITVNSFIGDSVCFTPLYTAMPNLNSDPFMNHLGNFGGWGDRSINEDPAHVYCGERSGLISGGSIDVPLVGKIKNNTTYVVRAMVKAASTNARVGVFGHGSPDMNVYATVVGEWAPIEFTFTTGTLAANHGLFFNNSPGSYIDNWEIYEVPNPDAYLKHLYTFDDGTANDEIGTAHGTLMGGATITNNALNTQATGNYLSLPAADIALNTYNAITMEMWYTPLASANTGFTMLSYFGNTTGTIGTGYYMMSTARGDDVSRTAISTNNTSNPWATETGVNGKEYDDGIQHHMVSVIDATTITLFIDGVKIGTANLSAANNIASIGTQFAYLAKAGYTNDPTWKGLIHKFAIYNKALNIDEVLAAYDKGAEDQAVLIVSQEQIALDNFYKTTTFNVTTVNLADSVVITAPAGISVSPSKVAPNATSVPVTVTYDGTTAVDGMITLVSGSYEAEILVKAVSANCFTPWYPELTNLVPDPYLNSLALFGGWGEKSIVNLFNDPDNVYCGASSAKVWKSGSIDVPLVGKIAPNTTYIVRAKVKTAPGGEFQLGIFGWGGAADINHKFITNGAWSTVEFEFTTGATLATNHGMFFNNWACVGNGLDSISGYIDNWEMYVAPANTVTVKYQSLEGKELKADRVEEVAARTGWVYRVPETDKQNITANGTLYVYSSTSVDSVVVIRGNAVLTLKFEVVSEVPVVIGNSTSRIYTQNGQLIVDVEAANATAMQVLIYSAQGVQLISESRSTNAGKHREIIPFDVPNGVYFVQLTIEGQTVIHKLLK